MGRYVPTLIVMVAVSCGKAPDERDARTSGGDSCFDPHHSSSPGTQAPLRTTQDEEEFVGEPAVARIYERNLAGNLIDIEFMVTGDGFLNDDKFSTKRQNRVHEPSLEFIFPEDTEDFRETSLFANAVQVRRWFANYGVTLEGKIEIVVDNSADLRSSNAVYRPARSSGQPATVTVGEGCCRVLQNLQTDADVMTHELSHHVIFRHIANDEGVAVLLHEGIADFLTMMRNDDSCLGRTVCPEGGGLCWKSNQCLRNADNQLTLLDHLPDNPHIRSQVISGMLWQIRQDAGMTTTEATELTLTALSKMNASSDVEDFVDSLHRADLELFDGQHCPLISEIAEERVQIRIGDQHL